MNKTNDSERQVNILFFRLSEKIMITDASIATIWTTVPELPVVLNTLMADQQWIEDAEDYWRHAYSHGKFYHATQNIMAWAASKNCKNITRNAVTNDQLIPLSHLAKLVGKSYRVLFKYATTGTKKSGKILRLHCHKVSNRLHSSKSAYDEFIKATNTKQQRTN